MHYPVSISIGGRAAPLHGILEFVAIFCAFRYYLFLRKRQGDIIKDETRLVTIIGAALGAVVGSRLLGALENLPEWLTATDKVAYFNGNRTLVGGLLGGLIGVELGKKIVRERTNTGDLFTQPLILGMIIGRIGCFSAGIHEQTYGLPTNAPWGMNLGDGIKRHPVTLYEIVFLIALWGALNIIRKNYSLQQGALFKIFLIFYLVFRLSLDFIKPGWRYCLGLGTIQLACLAGLAYYIRYIFNPWFLLKNN
jgi:prolipoprotein diacylglyceryltransferase